MMGVLGREVRIGTVREVVLEDRRPGRLARYIALANGRLYAGTNVAMETGDEVRIAVQRRPTRTAAGPDPSSRSRRTSTAR